MLIPVLAVAAVVLGQANSGKIDLAEKKANLRVLTDGANHFIVVEPDEPYGAHFYFGNGRVMNQCRVFGGGKNGTESYDVSLWDPRFLRGNGVSFTMRESGKVFELACGERKTTFKPATDDESKKVLESGSFIGPAWTRLPERLLRDDRGNYYFVDRFRATDRTDRRDFRLFVGPRGKMTQMPLKDIVDDSEGMIFSTKNGSLRLVFAAPRDEAGRAKQFLWISEEKSIPLTDVPLDNSINGRLVYLDLGPYAGQRLGTPCDDLM
jgi:hypothetical protein